MKHYREDHSESADLCQDRSRSW